MALAHVQTVQARGSNVTSVTTAGVTTTSGNLLVAQCMRLTSAAFSSFTDSNSNTWSTAVVEGTSNATGNQQRYVANCTGGASHTFTLTLAASGFPTLFVTEVSGAATSSVLDQTAAATNNASTAPSSGATATRTTANQILIGSSACDAAGATLSFTAGGSFTIPTNGTVTDTSQFCGGVVSYKIVSATGTDAASYTLNATSDCRTLIGTYKEAAGGGGGRTTKNTRTWQLGSHIGMGWRMPI